MEAQVERVPDDVKPGMHYLIEKLKARIETLESGK